MKKIFALVLFLCSIAAHGATVYACACGAGVTGSCVAGSNTAPYDTPAKAINTPAQWKTSFQALAAGDHLSTCQGGAFDGFGTGNMQNTNCTKAAPCVIDSYDDSARWSGGAGVRPKLNDTAGNDILSFNKSSGGQNHTEGYTIKDIELVGNGTTTTRGIFLQGDSDYVVIDNVKVTGMVIVGIQCNAGSLNPPLTGDGISQHFVLKNSTISNNNTGVLCNNPDSLFLNNTLDHNGVTNQDHHLYVGGITVAATPKTISSITGNGATATMTTATPHGIATGTHFTINVSGSTSSGTGTFNVTGGEGPTATVGTVTGASTITYPATGTPTASVVGAYSALLSVVGDGYVVRGNTTSNGNKTTLGACNLSHIVFHGTFKNILVEGNSSSEATTPTPTTCVGIEIDDGGYDQPEDYNGFTGVIVRHNTVNNIPYGIMLDATVQGLVENNWVNANGGTNDAFGITMRSKNFVPGSAGSSTLPAKALSPHNITIRYNSVYLPNARGSSWGIALNGNIGDPLTGSKHNLYGNAVVLGSTLTANTMCFDTENMTLAMFDVKDYNACYYLSATVPKWENTSSLATIQAAANANKSDLHSTQATTANISTGQPFFLTGTPTTPAIGTSSGLKNAGHPTLGPRNAWGGAVRNQAARDIGAFEFGATLGAVPGAPTRIGAQ